MFSTLFLSNFLEFIFPLPIIVHCTQIQSQSVLTQEQSLQQPARTFHQILNACKLIRSRPLQPTLLGLADAVNLVAVCQKPRILKLMLEGVLSEYVVVGGGCFPRSRPLSFFCHSTILFIYSFDIYIPFKKKINITKPIHIIQYMEVISIII